MWTDFGIARGRDSTVKRVTRPTAHRLATRAARRQDARQALYAGAVAATVAAHLGYLVYLPSGGFLVLRWPRSVWLHVPVVVWGIAVVTVQLPCPLTWLEQRARDHAGMAALRPDGFIGRYVAGVVYPADATRHAQMLAFVSAASPGQFLPLPQRATTLGSTDSANNNRAAMCHQEPDASRRDVSSRYSASTVRPTSLRGPHRRLPRNRPIHGARRRSWSWLGRPWRVAASR